MAMQAFPCVNRNWLSQGISRKPEILKEVDMKVRSGEGAVLFRPLDWRSGVEQFREGGSNGNGGRQ
jgi:hypothetical protein